MPFARNTDPQTSHDAATSVTDLNTVKRAILDALQTPMPDETLVRVLYGLASESGLRSRRAELVRAGHVKDSGDRATTKSGRKAIVWSAA